MICKECKEARLEDFVFNILGKIFEGPLSLDELSVSGGSIGVINTLLNLAFAEVSQDNIVSITERGEEYYLEEAEKREVEQREIEAEKEYLKGALSIVDKRLESGDYRVEEAHDFDDVILSFAGTDYGTIRVKAIMGSIVVGYQKNHRGNLGNWLMNFSNIDDPSVREVVHKVRGIINKL